MLMLGQQGCLLRFWDDTEEGSPFWKEGTGVVKCELFLMESVVTMAYPNVWKTVGGHL